MKAVIFDLDGVIVSTDELHYRAWKEIANSENIEFTKQDNERLRGVSRMQSLEIILEKSKKLYSNAEKEDLASAKNNIYRELLVELSDKDILPGVKKTLTVLKNNEILMAIGSSSKNTTFILEQIGLSNAFDAIADGNHIKNSKPDPEVFLLAAQKLNTDPAHCVVIEDAYSGIEAAKSAGMKAIGVGAAATCELADIKIKDLEELNIEDLIKRI